MQVKLITGMIAGLFIASVAIAQSTSTAGGVNAAPAPAAPAAPADKMARPHHAHGQAHGPDFEQLDKDKDGAISKAEAAGHPMLSSRFDTIDGNKDGKLSKDELQAAHKAMQGKHRDRADAQFKAADKDGDGALSQQEAEAAAREKVARMFERLDTNKDGKLTQEEMRAGHGHGHQRKPANAS